MSNYYKQKNAKMAETIKQVESCQKDKNIYIPPQYRVKDPICNKPVNDHPMFIPTSRDYGLNPVTKETQVNRFPKSNKFSSGLIGKNYTNNSLNTGIDPSLTYSNSSLSF
eukprot:453997_1